MGVSNDLCGWWEIMWVGEKELRYYDEVVEWSEEEPTACVMVYWCGVDVDLQRVFGIGVGSK